MITEPTVFVMGAGASADVLYPIGVTLKQRILVTIAKPNGLYDAALSTGFTEEQIEGFIADFDSAAVDTIDDFLRHRKTYRDIGKFAIAYELNSWENEKQLKVYGGKSWYYDFRKMLGADFKDLNENNVRFVTFNYDRSLEHYLHLAFDSLSRDHSNRALVETTLKNKLEMLHVHGVISYLPWQVPEYRGGRKYGALSDPKEIFERSQGILIPDQRYDTDLTMPDGESLSSVLEKARRICFLGFGFAPSNVAKLGLERVIGDSSKLFAASAVGFEYNQDRQGEISKMIPNIRFSVTIKDLLKSL